MGSNSAQEKKIMFETFRLDPEEFELVARKTSHPTSIGIQKFAERILQNKELNSVDKEKVVTRLTKKWFDEYLSLESTNFIEELAKGNFVLVQLSNPEHIVCLQGISDDRKNFLYQDSDGKAELKQFPIARITNLQVFFMDEEHEGKDDQRFRFPAAQEENSEKVRKMLKDAHKEATKEFCSESKLDFRKENRIDDESEPNRWDRRHMYDVGHVLEFKRINSTTEFGAKDGESGVIIEDFNARFQHEISVKKGDKVQVTELYPKADGCAQFCKVRINGECGTVLAKCVQIAGQAENVPK